MFDGGSVFKLILNQNSYSTHTQPTDDDTIGTVPEATYFVAGWCDRHYATAFKSQ